MTVPKPNVRRRERQTAEPRTKRVNLAYNETEFRIIELAATRAGLTPASYAARTALDVAKGELAPMPTGEADRIKAFRDADVSLNRIGNNLNQIALVLNSGGEVPDPLLSAVLDRVAEAAERLMLAGIDTVPRRRRR